MTDIQKLMDEELPAALAAKAEHAKKLGLTCQIIVNGEDGGAWFLDCTEEGPSLVRAARNDASCTIEIDADDFRAMLKSPQANGLKLFFTNKMKLSGDLQMAMKLQKLLELP